MQVEYVKLWIDNFLQVKYFGAEILPVLPGLACPWNLLLFEWGDCMNVSNIIERQVAENPEKAAIIFGDRRISYAELDRLINRTAGGLLKMGYK